MSDAHSTMLTLAVQLAQRAASGQTLSAAQLVISDIMWLGTQVSPNGFDGWLAYTPCARIRRTLEALSEVGCAEVAEVVRAALGVAGVDPDSMLDKERQSRVDALSEQDRERLQAIDSRFHDVYDPSMELCRRYALEHWLL